MSKLAYYIVYAIVRLFGAPDSPGLIQKIKDWLERK